MKTKTLFILLAVSGLLTPFQNCSDVAFSQKMAAVKDPGNERYSLGELTFKQPAATITNKVDVLFVVDTSGSLDEERSAVATNIANFLTSQLSVDYAVDYRIAVLLAHASGPYSGALYKKPDQTSYVLSYSSATSTPSDLTALIADLKKKITNSSGSNLATDNDSDGGETGMVSIQNLLQEKNFNLAKDHGFFRTEAALSVIFVADENDICATYPQGISRVPDAQKNSAGVEVELAAKAQYCDATDTRPFVINEETTYEKLASLTNAGLLLAGIIYTDPLTVPRSGENEVGYGYTGLVALNNGALAELSGSLAAGLSKIGDLVISNLQLITRFKITDPKITDCNSQLTVDDIQVFVDNTAVPFAFVPSACEVQIEKVDAGKALSEIKIIYRYQNQTLAEPLIMVTQNPGIQKSLVK